MSESVEIDSDGVWFVQYVTICPANEIQPKITSSNYFRECMFYGNIHINQIKRNIRNISAYVNLSICNDDDHNDFYQIKVKSDSDISKYIHNAWDAISVSQIENK